MPAVWIVVAVCGTYVSLVIVAVEGVAVVLVVVEGVEIGVAAITWPVEETGTL